MLNWYELGYLLSVLLLHTALWVILILLHLGRVHSPTPVPHFPPSQPLPHTHLPYFPPPHLPHLCNILLHRLEGSSPVGT